MRDMPVGRQLDEERLRVSARLHSSITQSLSALTANLDLIAGSSHAIAPARRALLEESRVLARDCFQQVRALADDLYPPLVAEVGLRHALAALVADHAERTRTPVVFEGQDCPRLPEEVETTMYRVVDDCLSELGPSLETPGVVTLRTPRREVELAIVPATLDVGIRWRMHLGARFGGQIEARVARRGKDLAFVITVPLKTYSRR